MVPLLRGCATAGEGSDPMEPFARPVPPPLRRLFRRRSGHHGSRQPRRARGGRQDDRPEHPAAVRAGRQSLHHARAALRVPLLLHAEVLVRLPRQSAGDFSRRLRHARRDVRDPDPGTDQQAVEEDVRDPLRAGVLGAHHRAAADARMGSDRSQGSRSASVGGHARSGVRAPANPPPEPPPRARDAAGSPRRPLSPRPAADPGQYSR